MLTDELDAREITVVVSRDIRRILTTLDTLVGVLRHGTLRYQYLALREDVLALHRRLESRREAVDDETESTRGTISREPMRSPQDALDAAPFALLTVLEKQTALLVDSCEDKASRCADRDTSALMVYASRVLFGVKTKLLTDLALHERFHDYWV
ncbi:MAG: hypothetical protein HY962_05900 [Ignavibacteriae bacterium]|nr:hypothetical protein [Ignavibacteriota bacterium]